MTISPAPEPAFESTSFAPNPHLLRIRDLLYQTAGTFHPDHRLRFLQDHCIRRMEELRITGLREYLGCLTAQHNQQTELTALLNEMIAGETCFFPNAPHLNALRNVILPRIVHEKSSLPVRRLKIWSAGCSTGEEPYSLAILLMEESKNLLADWSLEIQATDLDERSVAHARKGLYDQHATQNLTPQIRQQYFAEESGGLAISTQARSCVTIQRLNLLDDSPMSLIGDFDIIFCCNVLIYFDLAAKNRVLQQFLGSLLPNGYLFLGHTESLFGLNDGFRLVHLPSATAYRKQARVQERSHS